MAEIKAKEIAPVIQLLGVSNQLDAASQDIRITGVAYDSRSVQPGSAFVCIPGEHHDGHEFIQQALKKGAACIFSERQSARLPVPVIVVPDTRLALALLADHLFDYPSQKLRGVGVTGTNGKTTVTHLVEHILNGTGYKAGLVGTLGSRWPGESGYQDIKHTTPQSADLHAILASMVGAGCSHAAIEVSSHALVQKRVYGCHFAVVCLTNVTQDHLDYHQTMSNYWRAKRRLFEDINASLQTRRTAVVNEDDPLAFEFLSAPGKEVQKLRYGLKQTADVYARSYAFRSRGMEMAISTPAGDLDLTLSYTGTFNVYNTMAALAICLSEGVGLAACKEALESFAGVKGRFQLVSSGSEGEPCCMVDYAHTPDGLDNVLRSARAIVPPGGRLIVVFGCGGDRDRSKRPQMGEIAESLADRVIVTSDNPRSEDPHNIIANILAGIRKTSSITVEPDRSVAIRLAVLEAVEADVVVIAGKGHENYQILYDRTIPFDDCTEVRLALAERQRLGTEKAPKRV